MAGRYSSVIFLFLLFASSLTAVVTANILLAVDPLVADTTTASIVLGPVTKAPQNPLMAEDEPWEAAWWNTNPSLFYKDNAFHMYYTSNVVCGSQTKEGMCPHYGYAWPTAAGTYQTGLLYANSTDGLNWQKPHLGLVPAPPNGSKANNIVINAGLGNGVFFDQRSNTYRQFGHSPAQDCPTDRGYGLAVSSSSDGLHNWTNCTSADSMGAKGDTSNNALWDEELQQYLAFTRIDVHHGGALGMRREARSISKDFVNWSRAEQVLAGEANYEIYSLTPFKPAAGARAGLYFALGMFYNITGGGNKSWTPAADRGQVYCELLMSTDSGGNWTRLAPHTEFIPHGPPGSHDSHTIYAAARPLESPHSPGTMLFYYAGGNGPHSGPRSDYWMLATAPSSALAGYIGPGSVTTLSLDELMQDSRNTTLEALLLHHSGGAVNVAVIDEVDVVAVGSTAAVPERQLGQGVIASKIVWAQPVTSWKRGVKLRFTLAAEVVLFALELQ